MACRDLFILLVSPLASINCKPPTISVITAIIPTSIKIPLIKLFKVESGVDFGISTVHLLSKLIKLNFTLPPA